jgi:hypothetical protein
LDGTAKRPVEQPIEGLSVDGAGEPFERGSAVRPTRVEQVGVGHGGSSIIRWRHSARGY